MLWRYSKRSAGKLVSRKQSGSIKAQSLSPAISTSGLISAVSRSTFSRPGKPTDNAFIESFNGKFRAECLNAHWFMSLDDARRKCEAWRRDYNEERPHSAIGNKAPIELIEGQWHAARSDRNWLEKDQRAGPRMGSSSANLKLTFHPDRSVGANQHSAEMTFPAPRGGKGHLRAV